MKLKSNKVIHFIVWTFVLFVIFACNQQTGTVQEDAKVNSAPEVIENEEVTTVVEINNLDRKIEFTEVPKRAVSLNQHVTEIMLALGLADAMVGTAYLDDEILPELKEEYEKIPVLADKYPSQEILISAEPDFVYAGWKSAFKEEAIGSIQELENLGIKAYLHGSSNKVAPSMEDVFTDIQNIGKIFGVEDRAEELTSKIKTNMSMIERKVGSIEDPIDVFVYDSGEKEPFTAAQNFLNNIITLAGGHNIFSDIEKGWASISWEEVVNRNPEIIVIMNYGNTSVDQKKTFLLNHPALQNVSAIVNNRFVVLPLSAGAEGIRGSQAQETLAMAFYPELFK